jgi:glycosyltransferase involved in cell wall biosynthesis
LKKRFLVLCTNEINYNPRLLKAADYLFENGQEVTVFNSIMGISSFDLYREVTDQRGWKLIENRMDKRTFFAMLNWVYCSVWNKLTLVLWRKLGWAVGSTYLLQKGLRTARINPHQFDVVIIHLVDSLPFAAKLKEKNPKLKLVYDSQEYFCGQYTQEEPALANWVSQMEAKHIQKVDYLLATTEVMRQRLLADYGLTIPSFRVRNVPYQRLIPQYMSKEAGEVLKIVWHGMTIVYGNRRGLHVLVAAIAVCKTEVHLYLQGLQRPHDMEKLNDAIQKMGIMHKVTIVPPAHPDRIVESLVAYDVGICSEIPEEENQQLTSSNKLFEYIAAGLCTIVTDVPGLVETVREMKTGAVSTPGNAIELAAIIDELNNDRRKLSQYKRNARSAAEREVYWARDYEPLYSSIVNEENPV